MSTATTGVGLHACMKEGNTPESPSIVGLLSVIRMVGGEWPKSNYPAHSPRDACMLRTYRSVDPATVSSNSSTGFAVENDCI